MSTTHRKRWVAIGAAFGAGCSGRGRLGAGRIRGLRRRGEPGEARQHAAANDLRHGPGGSDPPRGPGQLEQQSDRLQLVLVPLWPERRQLLEPGRRGSGQHDYLLARPMSARRFASGSVARTATARPTHLGSDRGGPKAPTPPRLRAATAARRAGSRTRWRTSGPANLIIDGLTPNPSIVGRSTARLDADGARHLVVRRPRPGRAGLRDGDAVQPVRYPGRGSPPGPTGGRRSRFQRLSGYPVSNQQELIAMFLRARKPGENVLDGIAAAVSSRCRST